MLVRIYFLPIINIFYENAICYTFRNPKKFDKNNQTDKNKMSLTLYSAGYTGSRLCRSGSSSFAQVNFDPSQILFFTSGWKFNLFYTRQQQWYACGDNECEQIGASSNELQTISLVPELTIKPAWAACGDKMTAIVSTDGQLFVSGASYGNFKRPVPIDRPIRFVACGMELVVAIPEGPGIYYSGGGNSNFKYVAETVKFIDCAAGQYHYLAISETGVAYSWGRRKACGQGRKFSDFTPSPIPFDENIKFKRCFAYNISSFLIDENDNIWSCGANNYGQIGLGRPNKTNVFKMITKFWQKSPVVHIACGDSMAYFLTEDGHLYACGESDNSRLLMNDGDNHKEPVLCDRTKDLNVVFMSAGCSHIIVLTGPKPRDFLTHPMVLMHNRSLFAHVPYFVPLLPQAPNTKPTNIDISLAGLSVNGFKKGDIIAPIGNNNPSSQVKILGLSQDASLIVQTENSSYTFIKENPVLIHKHYHIVKRPADQNNEIHKDADIENGIALKTIEGRSQLSYDIDTSDESLLLFGFRSGEKVSHECFGQGTIIGSFGSKLFIAWDHDDGKVSTTLSSNFLNLHSLLTIIEPKDRKVIRVKLSNPTNLKVNTNSLPPVNPDMSFKRTSSTFTLASLNYVNIETEPCNLIQKYNLRCGDLIRRGEKIGIVMGQLGYLCAVRSILSENDVYFVNPTSVSLLRTYRTEEVIVSHKSFNRKIVDVAVNCSKEDKFIPYDRILTKKGFATVIGRSVDPNNQGYWLLTDTAYKLNAGLVICKNMSDVIIVRRIGSPSIPSDKVIENSVDDFKASKFLPGDVVSYDHKYYVILGRNKDKQFVLRNKDGEVSIKEDEALSNGMNVIFRADIPCQRLFHSRHNFELFFEVDSIKFKGFRVFPGDRIQTSTGIATVVGYKANDIWIKYDDSIGAGTIPQQMIFDPNLFKVVQTINDHM